MVIKPIRTLCHDVSRGPKGAQRSILNLCNVTKFYSARIYGQKAKDCAQP